MNTGDRLISTTNTKAAVALMTLGARLRQQDPVTTLVTQRDGQPHYQSTYWFLPGAACTGESVEQLLQQFAAPWDALKLSREHPLCYIRAALENLETANRLRRAATPMTLLQRGQRAILAPVTASPELLRQLAS